MQKLEDRIERASILLMRLGNGDTDERRHVLDRVREALTIITKAWAKNECEWMWSKAYYWNKDMVELLIDQPAHWRAIVRGAREFVRKQCIEQLGDRINPQWRYL
jgi:hypothetical protein